MKKNPVPKVLKALKPKQKKISVVFICTGNTCRSPVAERIFKYNLKKARKLNKYRVSSAGLSAYDGDPMASLSAEVLKEAGIPYANHSSRFLSDKIIKVTDYFICMTEGHKNALKGLKDKNIYSVGEITGGGDVQDPYGGTYAHYKKMFDYLMYAMDEVALFIERKESEKP